ncbi:MAG: hypothetical protein H6Q15_288 [Bacteroidetes bacterium]|nr:hypothetical protein [Bacteroidota bacterium]
MDVYNQFFSLIGLIFYIFSIFISILLVSSSKKDKYSFKNLTPIFFILIVALYVLPLSLFNFSQSNPIGDISPQFFSFSQYIPYANILCAVFNITFVFFYKKFTLFKCYSMTVNTQNRIKRYEYYIIFLLLIISIFMLFQLSREVGGFLNLILSGYGVTNLFVGKNHYAVGFEWIVSLSIILWGNVLSIKNKKYIYIYMVLILILSIIFFIMGRRAVLVILIGTSVLLYYQLYKRISIFKLLSLFSLCFYLLTLNGFLRGDSYENFSSLSTTLYEKKQNIDNESLNYFYTLTSGNFAVPYETLPQIVKSLGVDYNLGLGKYSFGPISAIIPNVLWPDRPLPLSNWYMATFYDVKRLNEGRQFFLLTAPYMDFGPAGVILIGIFFAYFWANIVKRGIKYHDDVLVTILIALVFSNTLNMVSNDFLGWAVAFFKGYGFPVIILLLIRKIKSNIKYYLKLR